MRNRNREREGGGVFVLHTLRTISILYYMCVDVNYGMDQDLLKKEE